MKQRTLAMMTGFEQYTRKTRRAIFLEEMEQVVPWGELGALVAPHYPQPGKGRRPVGVERMLRIYSLRVRAFSPSVRTQSPPFRRTRKIVSGGRTAPLKPKDGLSGPPVCTRKKSRAGHLSGIAGESLGNPRL